MGFLGQLRAVVSDTRSEMSKIPLDAPRERLGYEERGILAHVLHRDLDTARKELVDFKLNHKRYVNLWGIRDVVNYFFNAVQAAYTAGAPLSVVRNIFIELVDAAEYGDPLYRVGSETDAKHLLDVRLDTHIATSLMSIGVCLHFEPVLMLRVIRLGGPGGLCRFYDLLARIYIPEREIAPPGPIDHYQMKFYTPLVDMIDLAPPAQAKALKTYVNGWYNNMRGYAWHDIHKSYRGMESLYTGYWAFQVAGAVCAFGLDDSSCRASPYYPVELVDYYRAHDGPPLDKS